MPRYIIVSFLFLGWAFYEISGGADFRPPERPAPALAQTPDPAPLERTRMARAARAKTVPAARARTPRQMPDLAFANSAERIEKIALLTDPPQPVAAPPPRAKPDLRRIVASRVNLRTGPGTDHNIMATLDRGQTVEVLESNGLGWLRLRTQPGDRVGWIAERLVSAKSEG